MKRNWSTEDRINGTTWTIWTPVPNVGSLNGVSATAPNDIWAAGDSGIIQWDGNAWSTPTTSPTPTGAKAIFARTSGDVWAVGSKIEHWDSTAWTITTPVPTYGALSGVAAIAADNVWAVGSADNGTSQLIMHKDSAHPTWTVFPTPSSTPTGATSSNLNSIDYFNSGSIWAVGAYGASGFSHTLTEYFDGDHWRVISSPNPSNTYNELYHIFVTALSQLRVMCGRWAHTEFPEPARAQDRVLHCLDT